MDLVVLVGSRVSTEYNKGTPPTKEKTHNEKSYLILRSVTNIQKEKKKKITQMSLSKVLKKINSAAILHEQFCVYNF